MSDPRFESALRDFETTANNFAVRLIKMAQVRAAYIEQIREMSQSIRAAVDVGEISANRGADLANQLRNEIMEMQRLRDLDLGRSLAQKMKGKGLTLQESIGRAMKKLNCEGRPFNQLANRQQREVLMEVIDSAGRSRQKVTQGIPRMRWAARGLWLVTFAVAAYSIGTAENPWWQTGRETANIAGGLGGSITAGALMGAAGGIWAGPIGMGIGIVVGGILGALLADHAYIEAAGTSDPGTRQFIGRYTNFWTGVDEAGIAMALVKSHSTNLPFVQRVFLSLNKDYNTDADDVAIEYVNMVRQDRVLGQKVRTSRSLKEVLIKILDEGWTSEEEREAVFYLQRL